MLVEIFTLRIQIALTLQKKATGLTMKIHVQEKTGNQPKESVIIMMISLKLLPI